MNNHEVNLCCGWWDSRLCLFLFCPVRYLRIFFFLNSRKSSVVRAPDSWLKGSRFESLQDWWGNFLLQGQLPVLTLIFVSVPPLCYRSSTLKIPVILPKVQVAGYSRTRIHLMYVVLYEVTRCMVAWCTQNSPRRQQFHVAPAMPAPEVHHFGWKSKTRYKKLVTPVESLTSADRIEFSRPFFLSFSVSFSTD